MMVAPRHFSVNAQTSASNAFQAHPGELDSQAAARRDCLRLAAELRLAGVDVLLFDDTESPVKPDAVFPNNWFSTHSDGQLLLYPMAASNRRPERRPDLLVRLAAARGLRISSVRDLSALELQGQFLESTGSLVFDHAGGIAYAAWSPRTHPQAAARVAEHLGYRLCGFDTSGPDGQAVYHSNVLMSIGEGFVVICAAAIVAGQREQVLAQLAASGREIIEISAAQMAEFAGNLLQLAGRSGPVIALSARAMKALQPHQLGCLAAQGELLPVDIASIEQGGGSVRCMLAEIFLPTRRRV